VIRVREAAERIVSKALEKGFEEAASRVVRYRSVMVKLANSEPSVIQRWDEVIVGAYLAKERRALVVEARPSRLEEVDRVVEELAGFVSSVKESPLYAPLPEPVEVKPLSTTCDDRILEAMKDPSELAQLVVNAAHEEGAERIAGMISLKYWERAVATSTGASLYEDQAMMETYVRAFIDEGSGQWALGSRTLDKDSIEDVARSAARYAREARKPKPVEAGVYDLILSPMVVGNLMNLVAFMSSALRVMMGFSIFSQRAVGENVASSIFTLLDDARNPQLPGSTAFDDEGMPTSSKPIIEEGVLRNLLHNSKTAHKMKARTTGNAGWIMPHSWTLRVEAGDCSLDEMISEVKRGLLVTNNWYTRLQNYVEGIFSTITRDALLVIEDGEVKGAATRLRIADKLPSLLASVDVVGKELYDIKWWEVRVPTRAPYLLIRGVHTSKHLD